MSTPLKQRVLVEMRGHRGAIREAMTHDDQNNATTDNSG